MSLFCLVFTMSLCASVTCALWSPAAGKGLTSDVSLVSWVRCGT